MVTWEKAHQLAVGVKVVVAMPYLSVIGSTRGLSAHRHRSQPLNGAQNSCQALQLPIQSLGGWAVREAASSALQMETDSHVAILRAWISQAPPSGHRQRVSSARDPRTARTYKTRHASLSGH